MTNPSRLALVLVIVLGLQLLTLAVQVAPTAKTLLATKPHPTVQPTPLPTFGPELSPTATPSATVRPLRTLTTPSATAQGVVR